MSRAPTTSADGGVRVFVEEDASDSRIVRLIVRCASHYDAILLGDRMRAELNNGSMRIEFNLSTTSAKKGR